MSVSSDMILPDAKARPGGEAEAPESQHLLIVDDSQEAGETLRRMLEISLGIPADLATNGNRALEMLAKRPYSVVLTDLRMPGLGGMELLQQIQAKNLPVTVVVMTGYGSINDAVEAMKYGAYDFLTKPIDPETVSLLVQRALRERTLQDELIALRTQLREQSSFQNILSKNPRMLEIFDQISCIADTNTTVLIGGETGTGKELVARAIHQASSARRNGPLVIVNCAALPESLMESELFGHEKGSFTGAAAQRKGRIEMADGGTLFLDEVGDIPPVMQVKLLRVLQERQFERVGGNESRSVNVRVIGATHRDLPAMVKEGKIPRRPLLSTQRLQNRSSAAPRTSRRHSPSRHAFRREVRSHRPAPLPVHSGSDGTGARPRLAGQRPRA